MENTSRYAMEWAYKHRWIAENMELLKDTLPHWETGLVIYNGTTLQKLRKDVIAVPAGML